MSVSERTYLAAGRTMPFCRGCGHGVVLRRLDEALRKLAIAPRDVCLVTDIGCIGLADALFDSVHTVHTTHGRSTAFATGIALADGILAAGRLRTIVLIGDGGAMIGLQHIVGAALLNADLTVLVCNNFLFGMTGGQNSAFSPVDFVTPTTPHGNVVPPLDVCRVALAAGAGFVARKLATDRDLGDIVGAAIAHPGFSLVEVVELCTEHATTRNDFKGRSVPAILTQQGHDRGVLAGNASRPDFATQYLDKYPRPESPLSPADDRIEPSCSSTLQAPLGLVVAGSAGERVQSAARRFCEAAMRAGLWCTQKNDNPVTQGSGHSLAEVLVSPAEILYTGIDVPDVVLVISAEGLAEIAEKRVIESLPAGSLVLADDSLVIPPTAARVVRTPYRKQHGASGAAAAALAHVLDFVTAFPKEALDPPG